MFRNFEKSDLSYPYSLPLVTCQTALCDLQRRAQIILIFRVNCTGRFGFEFEDYFDAIYFISGDYINTPHFLFLYQKGVKVGVSFVELQNFHMIKN